MDDRLVRFRHGGGLGGQLSEAVWPGNLPLPPPGLTVIEMPNGVHKGIAEDATGAYHYCIPGPDGENAWTSADDRQLSSTQRGYR